MVAAQCWCDEETSGTEMDAVLAEAVARRIAAWMDTAAQMARNAEFYRGLLDECAKHLGPDAYTSDDGTVMDEPLRLKVPELVAALTANVEPPARGRRWFRSPERGCLGVSLSAGLEGISERYDEVDSSERAIAGKTFGERSCLRRRNDWHRRI